MSTLRISNIEAKANASSPTVNEKLKFTSSLSAGQDPLLHLDGLHAASGITTIGINTTGNTITVKGNDVNFAGIVTATRFDGPFTDLTVNNNLTVTGDATFNGGAGAVTIPANSDIRFANGSWTGEYAGKIQQNSNKLYIQGGSSGWQFRSSGGTGRWEIDSNGHIIPVADSTYDIGTDTVRVKNVYADTLHGSGSNVTGISTAPQYNLDAISKTISDTAVDIFVYDTRKDSDGGAWRKRISHTSWYNETLGTATRGTRKEFPAVAVIIAETTQLTIYDGDDPELPMWMVFNLSGSVGSPCNMLPRGGSGSESDITSIACLNTKLVVGLKDVSGDVGEGLIEVNFISDFARVYREADSSYTGSIYKLPISGRNSSSAYRGDSDENSFAITAQTINDVAMTVLPNAPIDDTTGLPIPTIAASSNSALSIIKDDGTVINNNVTNADTDVANVDFTNDGNLLVTRNNYNYVVITNLSNSADVSYPSQFAGNLHYYREDATHFPAPHSPKGGGNLSALGYAFENKPKSLQGKSFALADMYGLNIYNVDLAYNQVGGAVGFNTGNSVAYITKDYNTGYMVGDIRGSFLSSTTVETVNQSSATELLTNGTAWTGASGTTAPTGWTSWGYAESAFTIYSGRLKIGNGAANNMTAMHQNVTTVVGQTYTLYFEYQNSGSADYAIIRVGTSALNNSLGYLYGTSGSNISSSLTFEATTTTTNVSIQLQSTGGNKHIHIDNWSLKAIGNMSRARKADLAGSDGLAIHGVITSHAVASGAELVGYRPNSSSQGSNYFKRPLTATEFDLTSDWSFNFWAKNNGNTAANYSGFEISPDDISSQSAYSLTPISLYMQNDGMVGVRGGGITSNGFDASGKPLQTQDQWRCFNIVRRGTSVYLYIDGMLEGQKTATFANPSTPYALNIFRWSYATTRHDGRRQVDFSLFRMSESAPSPELIKKMYNDEKHLFLANAKCTLYGSSNVVTAVAYDDSNDTLHVGTSSGRSDFVGLNRINNTTSAVTSAISASNGLVVDE